MAELSIFINGTSIYPVAREPVISWDQSAVPTGAQVLVERAGDGQTFTIKIRGVADVEAYQALLRTVTLRVENDQTYEHPDSYNIDARYRVVGNGYDHNLTIGSLVVNDDDRQNLPPTNQPPTFPPPNHPPHDDYPGYPISPSVSLRLVLDPPVEDGAIWLLRGVDIADPDGEAITSAQFIVTGLRAGENIVFDGPSWLRSWFDLSLTHDGDRAVATITPSHSSYATTDLFERMLAHLKVQLGSLTEDRHLTYRVTATDNQRLTASAERYIDVPRQNPAPEPTPDPVRHNPDVEFRMSLIQGMTRLADFTDQGVAVFGGRTSVDATDADGFLTGASLRVIGASASDQLNYAVGGGITAETRFDTASGALLLSLSGRASVEAYEAALNSVRLLTAAGWDQAVQMRVGVSVTDGVAADQTENALFFLLGRSAVDEWLG